MPFEIVPTSTVVFRGEPDNSVFYVHLENDIVVVGTSIISDTNRQTLGIHPGYMPPLVQSMVDLERQRRLAMDATDVNHIGEDPSDPSSAAYKLRRIKIPVHLTNVAVGLRLTARVHNSFADLGRVTRLSL